MNNGIFLNRALYTLYSLVPRSLPTFVRGIGRHLPVRQCSYCTIMGAPGSPNISITFLSSGSALSPQKSLVIVTAHSCYLINAPEAMSRVIQESGVRLSKISHIFVTGNQWELFGGLIGTCLNISGSGQQSAVNLHGPPIINQVANLMAKFSDTAAMRLAYNEASDYTDTVFQISSLNVHCPTDNSQSYCYLFKPIPLLPKLDMLKAVKMDFPISMLKDGVTANRLKAGESVELPDGRVINGAELLLHPAKAKSILVVDCATPSLAVMLAESQQLRAWISDPGGIDLAVHLADPDLLRSPQYRSVVNLFQGCQGVNHAVMDGRSCRPALYGAHQCQLMLNTLHDGIFPLLHGHRFMVREDSQSPPSADKEVAAAPSTSFPDTATSCETYQEYTLRPPGGFDVEALRRGDQQPPQPAFTEAAMREKVFEDREAHITRLEFAEKMAKFGTERATWKTDEATTGRAYPWVQFLGTVSSNPIKYRNVSSILLHISDNSALLLDCGEGTLFQLVNFYGEAASQAVLRSIRAICISHMHLDHQSGIFCLLKARRKAFADAGLPLLPCAFIGPRGFSRWLDFFAEHDSCGLGDVLAAGDLEVYWSEIISGTANHWNGAADTKARFRSFVRGPLGLDILRAVPVEHSTKFAFGFVLEGGGNSKHWKIVYSGDTVPCRSLVDAGLDCDLLIHEATFQDGLEQEAQAKRHSTVGQALAQSGAMRARHVLLTHFSARYTCAVPCLALPTSGLECGGSSSSVGFAYDHMCVGLGDLGRLPRLSSMLSCVFPKHFAELERRSTRLGLYHGVGTGLQDAPMSTMVGAVRRRSSRSTCSTADAPARKQRRFERE